MNKSDLVKEIAFKANITNIKAGHALDTIIANIADELANNRSVVLVGFGAFSLKNRAARSGRSRY